MPVERLTLEEEETVIRRAAAGDGEAFGVIYDTTRAFLYSAVIYPRVGNPEAAEEILHETYLLALKKLPQFQWRGRRVAAWLRNIALKKVMEWLAKRKKEPSGGEDFLDFMPDRTWQPEETVVLADYSGELRKRIEETLAGINERYRRAIELRLLRKLTREACASELDTSVPTFDVLFLRACRAFRKLYKEKYG